VLKFARWLRTRHEFPIRVPVYLSPREMIRTSEGPRPASFFAPYQRNTEPFIRIATGDYRSLKKQLGRDDALASLLCSLAHEVVHYQQWWHARKCSERAAIRNANAMIRSYSKAASALRALPL
jgi:hypothetical protein